MCDITGIGIGIAAAQAGAQYIAGLQAASATEKYNRQLEDNTRTAYASETAQGQTQDIYQDIKAAHAINAENMQARSAEATAVNSAGENGVGGFSVSEMARDYFNKAGQADSDVLTQRDASKDQIQQEIIGAGFQYQSRLNARKVVTEPSFLTPIMSVGGSAVGLISKFKPSWAPDFLTVPEGAGNQGMGDNGGGAPILGGLWPFR